MDPSSAPNLDPHESVTACYCDLFFKGRVRIGRRLGVKFPRRFTINRSKYPTSYCRLIVTFSCGRKRFKKRGPTMAPYLNLYCNISTLPMWTFTEMGVTPIIDCTIPQAHLRRFLNLQQTLPSNIGASLQFQSFSSAMLSTSGTFSSEDRSNFGGISCAPNILTSCSKIPDIRPRSPSPRDSKPLTSNP